MGLRKPESMEECVYFTQRSIDGGEVAVWVFKQKCTECNKGLMGKPRDKKGKVRTRSNEYVCQECGHRVEKAEYEDSLIASAEYVCPGCGYMGEKQVPFKRKNIEGVQTLRFKCDKCGANIDITKKMKEKKNKKK